MRYFYQQDIILVNCVLVYSTWIMYIYIVLQLISFRKCYHSTNNINFDTSNCPQYAIFSTRKKCNILNMQTTPVQQIYFVFRRLTGNTESLHVSTINVLIVPCLFTFQPLCMFSSIFG